jgi:L-lactate dehydrogenase complex protein LldF
MAGMKEFKHLSYASSLCGKCTEVCPVKIDIHKMLLLNRRDSVEQGLSPRVERLGWKGWKMGMMKRKMMDMFGGKFKNLLLKNFFKKSWGNHRELPQVAEKSFSKQWQEQQAGEKL